MSRKCIQYLGGVMVKLQMYVLYVLCCVVFRERARATQVVDLASAKLYMYLEAAECELWWLYTSMEIMKVVVDIPV